MANKGSETSKDDGKRSNLVETIIKSGGIVSILVFIFQSGILYRTFTDMDDKIVNMSKDVKKLNENVTKMQYDIREIHNRIEYFQKFEGDFLNYKDRTNGKIASIEACLLSDLKRCNIRK